MSDPDYFATGKVEALTVELRELVKGYKPDGVNINSPVYQAFKRLTDELGGCGKDGKCDKTYVYSLMSHLILAHLDNMPKEKVLDTHREYFSSHKDPGPISALIDEGKEFLFSANVARYHGFILRNGWPVPRWLLVCRKIAARVGDGNVILNSVIAFGMVWWLMLTGGIWMAYEKYGAGKAVGALVLLHALSTWGTASMAFSLYRMNHPAEAHGMKLGGGAGEQAVYFLLVASVVVMLIVLIGMLCAAYTLGLSHAPRRCAAVMRLR